MNYNNYLQKKTRSRSHRHDEAMVSSAAHTKQTKTNKHKQAETPELVKHRQNAHRSKTTQRIQLGYERIPRPA